MLKNIKNGYAYFSTAEENNGFVIQLYINLETGDWIITGIDNDLKACNILRGVDWQFLKIVPM